jgi:hypothetical protein
MCRFLPRLTIPQHTPAADAHHHDLQELGSGHVSGARAASRLNQRLAGWPPSLLPCSAPVPLAACAHLSSRLPRMPCPAGMLLVLRL